ncbi:hypothetical protein, partial [Crocosphaera watsonii]|uniref:hypothetical protein n=1 Tax=Crocosphaera watsonii TaxID=263511 RepID=UPI001E4E68C5
LKVCGKIPRVSSCAGLAFPDLVFRGKSFICKEFRAALVGYTNGRTPRKKKRFQGAVLGKRGLYHFLDLLGKGEPQFSDHGH